VSSLAFVDTAANSYHYDYKNTSCNSPYIDKEVLLAYFDRYFIARGFELCLLRLLLLHYWLVGRRKELLLLFEGLLILGVDLTRLSTFTTTTIKTTSTFLFFTAQFTNFLEACGSTFTSTTI